MGIMNEQSVAINRSLVGVLAIGCFAASLLTWLTWPSDPMWYSGFLRVGVLLVAFWLALPSRGREAAWARVSPWTFVGLILAVIGVGLRPKVVIPLLVVLAIIGFVLKPRPKKRPPPSV